MELLELIDKYCDIRRMKRNCNFGKCEKKPGKEMLIFQINMDTRTKKNIISIYLCSDHFREMERCLEGVVNKFKSGKMYRIKGFDIGFVTY
ncbi:MAG: hypothetical protein GTN38_03690 [Candidatus Aenigmarchaeota archaeon]|nr:hypothetical protein [Candidatus Aenigmarchaeota archaeon]NIP40763.1 hypothetical protein [Candidatus Aenigmarchaeota archaeon]NIQ18569.1 hypothetical protein [Candidatus Aenigmarchaeota archaeon]NIS73468.1 hypothetical protein [Candidatus Aenigmarchaeota archaeon]